MAATLSLDRFQLLWLFEGAAGKSHLRWDIYPMFVNDVFPQLSESERECIYTYIKRDTCWHWEKKEYRDETDYQYWLQTLARFNPANQYRVTMKEGRKKAVVVPDAYLWNGRYYVGWNRFCDPSYVVEAKKLPYSKCTNRFCDARDICLRNIEHKVGDKLMCDNNDWPCEKCDYIITKDDLDVCNNQQS